MSKYSKYYKPPPERSSETHPIWRGIGCLMIIIVPLIAYAGAVLLVQYGVDHGWPVPPEIVGYIHFPDWVWNAPVLPGLVRPIASYRDLWAVLLVFLVLLLLLSGIFSTVYAVMYRILGPSRYTSVDAPPSNYKPKVYKR